MPQQPTLFERHGLDGRYIEPDPVCWAKCFFCENYWCSIHSMHAHDCDCPPIEEWTLFSPYDAKLSEFATMLREEAISRADAAAKEQWKADALAAVSICAELHKEFTTTTVWFWLAKAHDFKMPAEPRAMGAVIRRAHKLGWIEPTDRFVNTHRASRHRAPVRVWRSLTYGE